MLRKAAFFDRDGVLNIDKGYVYKQEEFVWMPGAIETIRRCNELGYAVIVVTNQSGIARAYYEEADVKKLHAWMNEELAKQQAHIDAFYYCPHHVQGEVARYREDCNCRKPQPGMLLQATADLGLDRANSFMIGDKQSDMEAAANAGVTGYFFKAAEHNGNLYDFVKEHIKSVADRW
ncbi:MAG: D-glycero-beta-D-manno-heptose 1,7-bisphosphate 7-phosphatase [Sporomusaceae bacterium]|nr:D-glycero-beta-D-manno-heptose 1,7-bisphosphate 7-phosphatase [Sporomusaceae bacterium]